MEDAIGIDIHVVGGLSNQEEPDCKERSEDDAHGGAPVHISKFADPLSEDGSENTGRGGSDEHGNAGPGSRDDESDCEPRENRVADGITHHAHFSEHEETTR